jgi:hypothetical protein
MDEFERWMGFCAFGGLSLIDALGLQLGDIEVDGGRWFVDTSRDQFGTIRFAGDWDDASSRGMVAEMRIVRATASPSEEGSRHVMTEWRDDPVLGRPIAHRVEVRHSDDRLRQVFVVESIEVADAAFIDRITAVPEIDAPDPIRGPVSFTTVQDRRSGEDRFTTIDRGAINHGGAGSALPRGEAFDWRWVGWSAAGAIGVALIVLRIRRGV